MINQKQCDRTPPHPRRLSIENCSSTKTEKAMNMEDRKGTSSIPTRLRRLSLECPRYAKKDSLQIKLSDDASKPQPFDAVSIQKYGIIQDAEAVRRPYWHFSNGGSIMMGASISCQDPLKSSSTTRYIRSELLEQMLEHKFLLFSYQLHLNHQYLPEMRFRL